MNIYKLRNKITGEFSTGGLSPVFNKKGKTWTNLGHVKNHINLILDEIKAIAGRCSWHSPTYVSSTVKFYEDYLSSIEIVEFAVSETETRVVQL